MRLYLLTSIFVTLLLINFGCSSGAVKNVSVFKSATGKGSQALSAGIQNYEDGKYKTATKNLQNSLDLGLTFQSDAVQAHKYLAFIYCLSKQEKKCRDEFRKALEKDSQFDLKPEEAGHPSWGPIFRDVKAKRKK